MIHNTILIAGMPRSGTTLICSLLNGCDDTVALAEPFLRQWPQSPDEAVGIIDDFIAQTRIDARGKRTIISKHVNGIICDNWVEPPDGSGRLRRIIEDHGELPLNRGVSPDFRLVIKHPAIFNGLAPQLAERHCLFAMIRNPLAVLASWQTIDGPFHRGRMPDAERFCPDLKQRLDSISDRLDRQVALLAWQLRRYQALPPERILRYEDLIADQYACLSRLTPYPRLVRPDLTEMKATERYQGVDFAMLAEKLRPIASLCDFFYPGFSDNPGKGHGTGVMP